MTSYGFAVPFYEVVGEQDTLTAWADKRGRESIELTGNKRISRMDAVPNKRVRMP